MIRTAVDVSSDGVSACGIIWIWKLNFSNDGEHQIARLMSRPGQTPTCTKCVILVMVRIAAEMSCCRCP